MSATAWEGEVAVSSISQLRAAGLTEGQITAVTELRERCRNGCFDELTQERKRLQFVKWLFEHDLLRS